MTNKIIILDLDGPTSLGLIRSFKGPLFDTYAVNVKAHRGLGYFSKYVTKSYYKKNGYTEDELISLLVEEEELHGAHIFPASDEMVVFLLHYNEILFQNKYRIPSTNLNHEKLLDKNFIKNVAAKAGFLVPKTYSFDDLNQVSYPVILKPHNSLKYGKESFEIFYNNDDLIKSLKNKSETDFFLEDFIENDDLSMYELLLFRNYKKEISPICPIIKIRQFPPKYGSSSFIKTVKFDSFDSVIKKFLDSIDYVGLVDIELKFCGIRKKFFFIETNFRAGAPIILANVSGLNLPVNFISSESHEKSINFKEKYWMNDETDPHNLKENLCFFTFLRDLLNTNVFAVFSYRDPMPIIILLARKISKKIRIILSFNLNK
jgi:predicted ATP-grasp superfamily ATP-dependent carboligase